MLPDEPQQMSRPGGAGDSITRGNGDTKNDSSIRRKRASATWIVGFSPTSDLVCIHGSRYLAVMTAAKATGSRKAEEVIDDEDYCHAGA